MDIPSSLPRAHVCHHWFLPSLFFSQSLQGQKRLAICLCRVGQCIGPAGAAVVGGSSSSSPSIRGYGKGCPLPLAARVLVEPYGLAHLPSQLCDALPICPGVDSFSRIGVAQPFRHGGSRFLGIRALPDRCPFGTGCPPSGNQRRSDGRLGVFYIHRGSLSRHLHHQQPGSHVRYPAVRYAGHQPQQCDIWP